MKWLTQWKSCRDQGLRNWSKLPNLITIFPSFYWLLPASLCASLFCLLQIGQLIYEGIWPCLYQQFFLLVLYFLNVCIFTLEKGLWLYLGVFLLYINPRCQGYDWPGLSLRPVPRGARYCDWSDHWNCAE